VNALWRHGIDDVARSLVRDALLAGADPSPVAFDAVPMRDILAEDCVPPRIACLGALRHAWAAPRASDDDLAAVQRMLAEPPPEGEAARALAFWQAMRVAELLRARPDDTLLEVRKHMRLIDAELHALYMDRLT
jgi:hypothetical protein